jgi:ectoine hydroxylase-related dioxygenase (phytanoyl-CoA dioxygenase family)
LRLGQPPFPTEPPLAAARHVRPAPGKLVLFPSYMWHGTEPFTTDESRMTIAFDVVPV